MEWIEIRDGYFVSDSGEIRSPRKIMKKMPDKKGYLRVEIKGKILRIHRLVAAAFIPNPLNLPFVNHKDRNKTNNSVSNLEWCTQEQNTQHAIDTGAYLNRNLKGSNNGSSILTEEDVRYIRKAFIPRKVTRKMLGEELGVSPATIKDVILRKQWSHVV